MKKVTIESPVERTTEQWCDYLTDRCRDESVELWISPTDLFGWTMRTMCSPHSLRC